MAANFRICPKCGVRNRLDKEFCVSCGEPLEGVATGDPAAAVATAGAPADIEGGNPIGLAVSALLLLVVGVWGWRTVSTAAEPEANQQAFSMPAAPQNLPAPSVRPDLPGAADYAAGVAALNQGNLQVALERLRAATAAAPQNGEYHSALARALERSGAPASEYLEEFASGAAQAPTNARLSAEYARALGRAGRNADALRVWAQAISIDATNASFLRDAVIAHMKINDHAGARPYLERIVELDPADLGPRQDLAKVMESAGDVAGAIGIYRQILTDLPVAHISRVLLSEALMKQGRPAEALQTLDAGMALDANSGLLHREKGRVLDRMGRIPEAIASYNEYLRLTPAANDVATIRARIADLQNR